MALQIREATTPADFRAFAALIKEYVGWCRARYADDPDLIQSAFNHQSLETELATLALAYRPPNGRAYIAREDGDILGAVALRDWTPDICEMKRMFVPERHQGRGAGRALCDHVIAAARAEGYRTMRLDTARAFVEAIRLYESYGFAERDAYIEYPPAMKHIIVFMERDLS